MKNKEEQEDSLKGWGTVASLLSDAADLALQKDRDDIFNMISESFDEFEKIDDPAELFMTAFQFAFRVYHRMRIIDKDMPLNRVVLQERIEPKVGGIDVYLISNYDYKTFIWARKRGFGDRIDNNNIVVPAEQLTPAERARFDKKIENK